MVLLKDWEASVTPLRTMISPAVKPVIEAGVMPFRLLMVRVPPTPLNATVWPLSTEASSTRSAPLPMICRLPGPPGPVVTGPAIS